jgi:NAD(P)-dependent dehydrogenase (short-subunit alcohol dehydrogenase family)
LNASFNPMDLTGSTVLVTGASGGIGREAAALLSCLNARLVLTGRNTERLEETRSVLNGHGHLIKPFDLEDIEGNPRWVRGLASEAGPFRAVVHAAGRQITSPVRFVTPEAAESLFRSNVHSALMLARGFIQKECHAPESSLVFISSVMGLAGKRDLSVYSASKAALSGMARSLAVELAPQRIRVNCVAPAFVETGMLDELREFLPPEQFEAVEKAHPLGFGKPRDVANAIAFLIADTGRWITGTTLVLDGGYSAQ